MLREVFFGVFGGKGALGLVFMLAYTEGTTSRHFMLGEVWGLREVGEGGRSERWFECAELVLFCFIGLVLGMMYKGFKFFRIFFRLERHFVRRLKLFKRNPNHQSRFSSVTWPLAAPA